MDNTIIILYHISGLSNWINKLNPYLKKTNLHVFHFSKLQDVEYPETKDYMSYDISYYSYGKLKRLVLSIAPTKCLFLTFRSVLDFTMFKLCMELKIKTLLLEHGLMSNDTLRYRNNMIRKSPITSVKRQIWHIYKYLGYAFSSRFCMKSLRELYLFYLKGRFDFYKFDKFLLYSQHSIDAYKQVLLDVPNNSVIVGYPIFADSTQREEATIYVNSVKKDGMIYIHQPLIADGVATITYQEEKKYILGIVASLSQKYGKLTLLLHPRADTKLYEDLYRDSDVDVIKSPNNYKVFVDKKLVIGHYSTALLYGLYFDIPTILIDYPTLKGNELFQSLFPSFKYPKEVLEKDIHVNKVLKEFFLGKENTYQYIAQCIENN